MKFDIEIKTKTNKTIDIEFPVYLKGGDTFDNGHSYDVYKRIDTDGRILEITTNDDGRGTWEFETKLIPKSHLPAYLGDYLSASWPYDIVTKDEFYQKLAEFKKMLEEVPVS